MTSRPSLSFLLSSSFFLLAFFCLALYLLFDVDHPAPLDDLYDEKIMLPELQKIHDFGDGFVLYQFVWNEAAP